MNHEIDQFQMETLFRRYSVMKIIISVHFGPFGLFGPLQSISVHLVHFSSFGPVWSIRSIFD